MIWHFAEVWALLGVCFAAGCLIGTLVHVVLAAGPLAHVQEAAADAVEGAIGRLMRGRPGLRRTTVASAPPLGPPPYDMPSVVASGRDDSGAEWPAEAGSAEDHVEDSAGDSIDDTVEPAPEIDWDGEPVWEDEDAGSDAAAAAPPAADQPSPRNSLQPPARGPQRPAVEPKADPLPQMRPLILPAPRNGVPDNLQRIRGIGQKNEELLNSLGIFHFGQIAAWTPAEARWVASHLAFPERIERDDWIGQAIILATGGETGYQKAAERRRTGKEEGPSTAPEA